MPVTFRLTMHPGADGDCLVLSWGTTSDLHHIIVDLGRGGTYRKARRQLKELGNVELLVISHVDADHIAGAMPMVREDSPPLTPKRVWYNARSQLDAAVDRSRAVEPFSARQGEKLSRGIVKFHWPWNAEFASEIVSTGSPEAVAPIPIADGLSIRLLSPTDDGLRALLPDWDLALKRAKVRPFDPDLDDDPLSPRFERLGLLDVRSLAAETYRRDDTKANGASIAFVAEFAGRRVLLAADAHSEVLEAALEPLARAEGGRYHIDLMKVSHHGSQANTSPALVGLVDCTRFAFSTNGNRHCHPDAQTIARLLAVDDPRKKSLYFNYRQPSSTAWDSRPMETRWNYECIIPVEDEDDDANGTILIDI